MHQSDVTVDIRHVDRAGADIKNLSHFFYKVAFRCSGFRFILRYTDVGSSSEKAEHLTELFLCHAFSIAEKADAFADCHNKTSVQSFLVQAILVYLRYTAFHQLYMA